MTAISADQPGYADDHLDRMLHHRESLLRSFGAWAESSKLLPIVDRRLLYWALHPSHQIAYANKVEDLDNIVGPYTYNAEHLSIYRKPDLVLIEVLNPPGKGSPTSLWVLRAVNERKI